MGIDAAIAGLATELGAGSAAGAIGSGVVDAGIGAGLGAGEAALTHGNVGIGALTGGITGGAVGGFGGAIGDATGLGVTGGDAIAGAAGGALGAGLTGGNALTGALGGGVSGLAAGVLSGPGVSGGDAGSAASGLSGTSSTTAGPSAASVSAPTGGSPTDLTQNLLSAPASGGVSGTGQPAVTLTSAQGSADPSIATGALNAAPTGGASSAPTGGILQQLGLNSPSTSFSDTAGNLPTYGTPSQVNAVESAVPALGGSNGVSVSTGGSSNTLGSASQFLNNNGKLLGTGVAGVGLLKDFISGNQPTKGLSQIQQLASQSAAQGQVLQSYLQNGTLPPAVQASVNAATADGITAIKSKYASMGIAPNSSAEVEDIARLQQSAVIQGATLADQLLQQGISETQLSGTLYNEIVQANSQQDAQTGQAISAMAQALAGGGIKLGTNTAPTVQLGG